MASLSVFADNYPKNPDIDILNYSFQIVLSDDTDLIEVEATIDFTFKKEGMKTLRLDFVEKSSALDGKGMAVDSITEQGETVKFVHSDGILLIRLAASSADTEHRQVVIVYSGIPAAGLKIAPNKYGDRTFFSGNWPNKGRNWLPLVDHPYDKATSEFIVYAPEKYKVVSNGLLKEESTMRTGIRKTHWKQSVPIPVWQYALGVAEFAVQYVDTFDGKSIQTWVYKQDRDAGFYDFAVPTKQALSFYSEYVGPFAYEKLANIQSNSVGGGMEAASSIFYGDKSVTGERTERWRNVIIHEIAHQWFGNSVTEYDWDDVWLSEGITTYFTLLFIEHAYGRDAFVEGLKKSRETVFEFYNMNPNYRIAHDDLSDMGNVTTRMTYQKGAWIMHMLRNRIGDVGFRKGIRSYYRRFYNGNASTSDLIHEMESVSGQDLDGFFQQWLYQGGNPRLKAEWNYDSNGGSLEIILNYVQGTEFQFNIPVEIEIVYGDGSPSTIETLQLDEKSKKFTIPVKSEPVQLVVDPDTKLLAEWKLQEKGGI